MQIDDYERTYTTWELIEQIQEQKLKGFSNITALWIEIHRRTADAVTSFLLTILAVSISSRKVRGGMGLHFAAGMFIGYFIFMFSILHIIFVYNSMIHIFIV